MTGGVDPSFHHFLLLRVARARWIMPAPNFMLPPCLGQTDEDRRGALSARIPGFYILAEHFISCDADLQSNRCGARTVRALKH